jgi:hypothetical protein
VVHDARHEQCTYTVSLATHLESTGFRIRIGAKVFWLVALRNRQDDIEERQEWQVPRSVVALQDA